MTDDDGLLPVSALQHLLFCERQCALIHVERVWLDNALTVEGTHLHRRVDDGVAEARGDEVTHRSVPLRSSRLGLTGIADMVEFHRADVGEGGGVHLKGREGLWKPRPVEYKRGRPKSHRADEVQLCAQAFCLEEMLGVRIPAGILFYGQCRRRCDVPFDEELRALTERSVVRLREIIEGEVTPPARLEPKCESCSLKPACLPEASVQARRYIERHLRDLHIEAGP